MKTCFFRCRSHLGLLLVALSLPATTSPAQFVTDEASSRASLTLLTMPTNSSQPRVLVDPRVELVSLIFRLAGNPEYNRGRIPKYLSDADRQFRPFANHPVVTLARQLRETRGVSFDACMSLAVLMTDASDHATLRAPLTPWPDGLDDRWTAESASNFVRLAGQFVQESKFNDFLQAHQDVYTTSETRLSNLISREAHLEWFNRYFGETGDPGFTIIVGLFNGGNCYGTHTRAAAGREEFYCILGAWTADKQGLPAFEKDVLPTVVHEFCHSYANPIIDRHWPDLESAAGTLYQPMTEKMRSQNYGAAKTLLYESLVRASVVRYVLKYEGQAAADREIADQVRNGFQWMPELSSLFGQYEAQRSQYPTLDSFSPKLIAFFNDYAPHFAEKLAALNANRPKVVSLIPTNDATDVDPKLTTIEVVFDRPMMDQSWSMCGGGPNFPELVGKPKYDSKRTTWTVSVKLQPDHDYEFWLNNERYQAFQSQGGVPLESVHVTFHTAK